MKQKLFVKEFKPIALTLDRIGPFRESPYAFDFTDQNLTPCNFYLLISKNGFGKSTVLETFTCLMNLLGQREPKRYCFEDLDYGTGRAQLDIRLCVNYSGKDRAFILSIIAGHIGEDVSLKLWDRDHLERHNASEWLRFGFISSFSGHIKKIKFNHDFVEDFLATIDTEKGAPPEGFNESAMDLPTVLSFSAYRDIPKIDHLSEVSFKNRSELLQLSAQKRSVSEPNNWGYEPVRAFSPHSREWSDSLDNLLIWLKWLGDGRFEKAIDLINRNVFEESDKFIKGIDKARLEAVIKNGESDHRLDCLSSGEKNMVLLLLRIGAHMTQNTIILVDEFDIHLHIRWQYRLFKILKRLVSQNPGFTIFATTHSTEILETYAASIDVIDDGVVKGGHLIEDLH